MLLKQKILILFIALLLSACGGSSSKTQESTNSWYHPTPSTSWHWQLQGEINTNHNVELYDIDLFDSSKILIESLQARSIKVICYFSGGSYENWRSDANQFKATDLGKSLDGWEGERWLDIRSTSVRNIMKNRLDLARQKGCNGVEPDNMDGYTNDSGFTFNAEDQISFNQYIAKEAHARNLSVGLKNDLDQITALVDDFDFAVNEQCFEFNECDLLNPFIQQNKAVFNAEYKQVYINNITERNSICTESKSKQMSTLILPLNLDDSFRISCL